MTTTLTIRDHSPRTVLHAPPPSMHVQDALATVSELVADLDPRDAAWADAGPHVTAVVDAVRHALDGSRSPIAPGEDVGSVLRLRDLASAAHGVAGRPATVVGTVEVSGHLAALAEAVGR